MSIKRLIHIIEYAKELLLYYFLFPIGIILYRKKHIFLFAERGNDARDNAYHLFKFYTEEHPEINAYYVIDKKSPDLKKIIKYDRIIYYRSLKHYLFFIAADFKISTHIMGCSPHMYFYSRYRKYIPIIGKKVFLQHGIIKDDLKSLYSVNTDLDLFICGAKPEYEFVKNNFQYGEGIVKYTGLARYDNLHSFECKKQILIMPTWRVYLKLGSYPDLVKSKYIECWNKLINNDVLNKILCENEIKLVFYPHYELQKHLDLFSTISNNVIVASFDDYDVQQLLKESMMLITDYSSVYFDMAYMGKPCIYYQFDRDEFFSKHYTKGYYDYYTMGFGIVCEDETMVIESILKCINNNFLMEKEYENRVKCFFEKRDTLNCMRIYDAINGLNK